MKNCLKHLFYGMLGALVFCILLEKLTIVGIGVGATAGILLCALLRPVGGELDGKLFVGLWFVRYAVCLCKGMLRGTMQLLPCAFRRSAFSMGILHIHPHVGERERVLVSNSVTLTPGTVTLEESAHAYTVLCMSPPREKTQREAITGDFESKLRNARKQREGE